MSKRPMQGRKFKVIPDDTLVIVDSKSTGDLSEGAGENETPETMSAVIQRNGLSSYRGTSQITVAMLADAEAFERAHGVTIYRPDPRRYIQMDSYGRPVVELVREF